MTSRKDPLASFIWTVGAADMVIGGVGERGSLFTLGLLTVGAGLLVRWLRQQHQGQKKNLRSGRSLSGVLPSSGKALSAMTRDVSALVARRFRATSIGPSQAGRGARSRDGYSAKTRPGFHANSFVNVGQSRPAPVRSGRVRPGRSWNGKSWNGRHPVVGEDALKQRPVPPPSVSHRPMDNRSADEARSASDSVTNRGTKPAHRAADQGPPLNLPPAPRSRTRRGRRIY